MRVRCLESSSSSCLLLSSIGDLSAIPENDKDSAQNEKQEELTFFNEDGTSQKVIVEENLIASDLCQLLAVRNRVPKDGLWTIVESWPQLGLERYLEDHEEVLKVYRQTGPGKKFIFRKQPFKYDFFTNPGDFYPEAFNYLTVIEEDSDDNKSTYLETLLDKEEVTCPPVFTPIWHKDRNSDRWYKGFLLLKDSKLFMSSQIQNVAKLVRPWKHRKAPYSTLDESDQSPLYEGWEELDLVSDVKQVQVYRCLNSKRQLGAPTEFGLNLRPTHKEDFSSSLCLSTQSSRDRHFWITTMRLAKYGKQLRENYRSFKNKQMEQTSPKDYNRHSVPNESVRSRVAMDFTGSVGRIVDDPTEANAIALSEGLAWKKRWRLNNANIVRRGGGELEVHITQPWFHKGMTRQEATNLIRAPNNQDGVFLVRESRTNPGCYVLTFKCASKVIHMPIEPIMDIVRDTLCFTLDSGVTKFYDILQLVEFYQLNAGCLPTRLTHYLGTQ